MTKEKASNKIALGGLISSAKSFFGLDLGYGGVIETQVVNPLNYRSSGIPFGSEGWNFGAASGYDVFFSYTGLKDIVKAYERCGPVFSIVNKQATAFVNGKVKFVDQKGKELDPNSPKLAALKALLDNPNPFQNWKQFEAQVAIYLRLFGYCIILPNKPSGFPNSYAKSLWIIPPYMCDIQCKKQMFYNVKGNFIDTILVKYGNEEAYLIPDDVIILKDITPGFNNSSSPFLPNSPIKSVQQNISNIISIYDSKGMLIDYRGALGIITPEKDPAGSIPLEPKEKQELQSGLMRYGLKSGQWKFIVANQAMKWQQIGIKYKDLMLTEWAEDDTMIVSDALNYPYQLLANGNTKSSIAGNEAESYKKQLYQDFVIPWAEMIYEQLSGEFETEKSGFFITKDFSHITVLQEDKINAGRARYYLNQGCLIEWQNNLITANDWRALNAMESLGPEGDKYYSDWVAAGKVFGSGKGLPANTDTVAQNVNDNPNANS